MAPVSSASQADPNLDELHSYGLGGRAAPLVIVSFVMFFVALLLVGNRLVCRMTLKKPLGMDDYVIALSLVCTFLPQKVTGLTSYLGFLRCNYWCYPHRQVCLNVLP